jgi:hypothetical protein
LVGRPPMSSMDSTGEAPRHIRHLTRVGTVGTVQSDETDDLQVGRKRVGR